MSQHDGLIRERLEAPRRRLTERVPAPCPAAVEVLRLRRRLTWLRDPVPLARETSSENLPVRVTTHRSLLLRTLGASEMSMQHNKVQNLRIVADRLDGLLLDNGAPTAGVGGGICQMANLLHWMVLHTPLTVVERSEQLGPDWYRHNEIWRDVIDRRTGNRVDRELVEVTGPGEVRP